MLALREDTRPIPALNATRVGAPTLRRPRTSAPVPSMGGRIANECIVTRADGTRTIMHAAPRTRTHTRTAPIYRDAPHRITARDLPSIHVGSDDAN